MEKGIKDKKRIGVCKVVGWNKRKDEWGVVGKGLL